MTKCKTNPHWQRIATIRERVIGLSAKHRILQVKRCIGNFVPLTAVWLGMSMLSSCVADGGGDDGGDSSIEDESEAGDSSASDNMSSSGKSSGDDSDSGGDSSNSNASDSDSEASADTQGSADTDSDDDDSVDTGDTNDSDTGDPSQPDDPFSCDGDKSPDPLPLRRLSKQQYSNTLRDLLRWAMPSHASESFAAVQDELALFPEDRSVAVDDGKHGGFQRMDQDLHDEHVEAAYMVAIKIGNYMTEDDGRMREAVGECAVDQDSDNDESCLEDFLQAFGKRALRRPLKNDDIEFLTEVAHDGEPSRSVEPTAIADAIAVLLTSPELLYFVEHGQGTEDDLGRYELSDYELASRLSYHFWQTMPDEELFAAAKDGSLSTKSGYATQVERLFESSKTDDAIRSFYKEWFWLNEVPRMDLRMGTPVYDAFLDGVEPSPQLHQHMIDEVLDMVHYYVRNEGDFSDVLTSTLSFAKTEDLAEIYETPVWEQGEEPPEFDNPHRVGLLARAAMIATGSANTRPIMKGVFIRKGLLCELLPPPPDNANADPPKLSEELTTREVVEELTEQPNSECVTCHSLAINPFGFVSENFDSIGRYRTHQRLFDADGELIKEKQVNTRAKPTISFGDDRWADGLEDLATMLDDSMRAHSCMVRNYFRYTYAREEHDRKDGCSLKEMYDVMKDGGNLADVLKQVALQNEFKTRSFGGDQL